MQADESWTLARVSTVLSKAGVGHDPRALELHARDDRLAVELGDNRMAWFPLNEEGRTLLAKEHRVLKLLARYCSFQAPRVLYEDGTGWGVRTLVRGAVNPAGLRQRVESDSSFAYAFGQDVGKMLAEQHSRVPPEELSGWLPRVPNWPRPEDVQYLPEVVTSTDLLIRISRAMERRTENESAAESGVLVHADVALHNLVVDGASHRVVGIFDYEGAVFADRHQDFAYMTFQQANEPMLDGALAIYEPETGVEIDRSRVRLLNAVAAIGFLASRHGHPPEAVWCGRTLAQDLAWTDSALRRAGL